MRADRILAEFTASRHLCAALNKSCSRNKQGYAPGHRVNRAFAVDAVAAASKLYPFSCSSPLLQPPPLHHHHHQMRRPEHACPALQRQGAVSCECRLCDHRAQSVRVLAVLIEHLHHTEAAAWGRSLTWPCLICQRDLAALPQLPLIHCVQQGMHTGQSLECLVGQ